jgi:glutaminyl-tRNA synthetase
MSKTDLEKTTGPEPSGTGDFIRTIVAEDVKAGKNDGHVQTRFPPEPNGYLHIGHAKSICLNFGIAREFGGKCNLRFDDTNPLKEETEYVDAIKRDIHWLGFDWEDRELYASDYYDQLYEWAVKLIKDNKAYVDDLSPDEIREYRGTLTEPGRESPHRNRSVEENLDLFERMRKGEFPNGSRCLRAKIDMASGNINMRDPVMYRIVHTPHHRTGEKWCLYPTYDWAHGQSDSIEKITHSLCDLSFEDHRPLYNWFIEQLGIFPSKQYEFARLNITHLILSKRKLIQLVREGHVTGWDDPRMPTICGLRRRGYTPQSIRMFCDLVGVSRKKGSIADYALLEHCVREELNRTAPRVMAVLRPLKIVLTNYPEGQTEELEAVNNPEDESAGTRKIPFSKELFVEQGDFMEDPPKKFFRLAPGREVRLKHAYIIKCEEVIKDEQTGIITELRCTYDPESKSGGKTANRKIKGTLHWVSAPHAIEAEVREYDTLFNKEDPQDVPDDSDFTANLNPNSLVTLTDSKVEPSLKTVTPESRYQFLRQGYFCVDAVDSTPDRPVFNRTTGLRDTWAKIRQKQQR